jgi:hypothetical protein
MSTLWGGIQGGSAGPASVNARGLIYQAYRMLGVLRWGQGASADAMSDGLTELNQMLSSWNNERLLIFDIERVLFDLTAGVQSYVIGDDGARPAAKLDGAGRMFNGDDKTEQPIDVLADDPRNTGRYGVYMDGGFPTANLYVHPIPADGQQLVLYLRRRLDQFGDLDTGYVLPDGYAAALASGLAERLMPSALLHLKLSAPAADAISLRARLDKAVIKRANLAAGHLPGDPAVSGGGRRGWSWRSRQ